MADNKRDIELRIAATTSGSEQINKLAQQVDALAKEGGAAAPEFKKLGDELRKIGEQGNAVQALDALERQVEATAVSLGTASTRAEQLGRALDDQRSKTQGFKDAQTQARTAVDTTAAEIRRLDAELKTLNLNTDRAGKATIGYKTEAQRLKTELLELRTAQGEQRATLDLANRAYGEQARALRTLNREYTTAATSAEKLESSLKSQNTALDGAKQSLTELGVETTDAATALNKVEVALAGVTAEAAKNEAALRQQQALQEAVARANERNAALARNAAETRIAAAARVASAERAAASAAEAAALNARLAQQQLEGQLRDTEAAQKSLNDAFAKTGVRSAQAIQAEIDDIVRSLVQLKNSANVSGKEFNQAFASAEVRVKSLQAELRKTPGDIRRAAESTNLLVSGFRQLAAVYGGIELASKFIDANKQLETLRRSLTLVTGSTAGAERAIDLLKSAANNAGVAVGEIGNSFIKFRASLDGSNVPLETTERLFRAVVNASGQLGLSSAKTSLILEALAQTANKGVVSMEELRQQLGDSLPGALDLTAKGLGISTAELVKLTESGKLLAADFLPALRNALVDTYGDGAKQIDGFAAAWNRFKNTLTETSQFLGAEGGVLQAIALLATQGAIAVRGLSGAFEFLGRSIGITAGFLATFDLTSPIQSFKEYTRQIRETYDEIETRLQKANGTFKSNAAAQGEVAAAGDKATASQQRLAGATGTATTAAGEATSGWAKLSVEYVKVREQIEAQITIAEKLSAAKRIEADARIAIVEISGDEAAVLRETAAATREETIALENVAKVRQLEVTTLTTQRDKLIALAQILGDPGGARAKEIEAINASIAARTAETEKAVQSAEASRLDAEAKAIAVKTYNDNSLALDSLRAAYDRSREALIVMQRAQESGLATSEQVRDAQLRLSQAEALYRDAVQDTSAALERKVRAARGSLSVTEAQISLEREKINTELQSAQATGNSFQVLQSTIALKELDIKLIQAKIAALGIEAKALREQAAAELAALQATDPLLAQKRTEIELRLQNAKAKELEAQRNSELIKQINAEIDALRNRGVQSSSTANGYVNDRNREAAAVDKVRSSVEDLAAAERKRRGVDQNGFATDSGGNTISASGPTYTSIYNQLKSRGLSDQQARSVAEEFVDGNGRVPFSNNPGQRKYGGPNSTIGFAVDRAAEKFLRNGTAGQTTPSAPSGGSGGSYTVNVNLNGQTTSINTASQSDAQNLVAIFSSLGSAAGRAGPGG